MAEIIYNAGYFNSVESDREYTAEDWNNQFEMMLTNGVVATRDGAITTQCQVTSTGSDMVVTIADGRVIVNGAFCEITTAGDLTLDIEATLDRIDRIIVEYNNNTEVRDVYVKILKGTASAEPSAPVLTRTANIYQLSLAQVYITGGSAVVAQSDITDERADDTLCGLSVSRIGNNETKATSISTTALIATVNSNAKENSLVKIDMVGDGLGAFNYAYPDNCNMQTDTSSGNENDRLYYDNVNSSYSNTWRNSIDDFYTKYSLILNHKYFAIVKVNTALSGTDTDERFAFSVGEGNYLTPSYYGVKNTTNYWNITNGNGSVDTYGLCLFSETASDFTGNGTTSQIVIDLTDMYGAGSEPTDPDVIMADLNLSYGDDLDYGGFVNTTKVTVSNGTDDVVFELYGDSAETKYIKKLSADLTKTTASGYRDEASVSFDYATNLDSEVKLNADGVSEINTKLIDNDFQYGEKVVFFGTITKDIITNIDLSSYNLDDYNIYAEVVLNYNGGDRRIQPISFGVRNMFPSIFINATYSTIYKNYPVINFDLLNNTITMTLIYCGLQTLKVSTGALSAVTEPYTQCQVRVKLVRKFD